MYSAENRNSKISVKAISNSMIHYILNMIVYFAQLSDEKIGEELETNFDCTNVSFDIIKAYIDKYQKDIVIGIAKSQEFIPKGYDAIKTYNLYLQTLAFLNDDKIEIPPLEMEFIIGIALETESEELHSLDIEKAYDEKIKTFDELEQILYKWCFNINEKEAKELRNIFESEMDNWLEEMNEDLGSKEKKHKKTDYLLYCINSLINPDDILEYSMYDNDFELLKELSKEEIQNSPLNAYLGIV